MKGPLRQYDRVRGRGKEREESELNDIVQAGPSRVVDVRLSSSYLRSSSCSATEKRSGGSITMIPRQRSAYRSLVLTKAIVSM